MVVSLAKRQNRQVLHHPYPQTWLSLIQIHALLQKAENTNDRKFDKSFRFSASALFMKNAKIFLLKAWRIEQITG